jgi:hypothetical protein
MELFGYDRHGELMVAPGITSCSWVLLQVEAWVLLPLEAWVLLQVEAWVLLPAREAWGLLRLEA